MTVRRGRLAAAVGGGLLLVAMVIFVKVRRTTGKNPQEYLGRRVDSLVARSYRTGREFGSRGDSASLLRAIGLFQEALDLDPTYAEAYAGRAAAYLALGCGGFLPLDDAFPKAKAAAVTALQLDSMQIEPHATLGNYYLYYERDQVRAEHEFQLATLRSPRSYRCQPFVRSSGR